MVPPVQMEVPDRREWLAIKEIVELQDSREHLDSLAAKVTKEKGVLQEIR